MDYMKEEDYRLIKPSIILVKVGFGFDSPPHHRFWGGATFDWYMVRLINFVILIILLLVWTDRIEWELKRLKKEYVNILF